jgi:hypothetical protein
MLLESGSIQIRGRIRRRKLFEGTASECLRLLTSWLAVNRKNMEEPTVGLRRHCLHMYIVDDPCSQPRFPRWIGGLKEVSFDKIWVFPFFGF